MYLIDGLTSIHLKFLYIFSILCIRISYCGIIFHQFLISHVFLKATTRKLMNSAFCAIKQSSKLYIDHILEAAIEE
jgi:hypothetical protein